MREANIEELRKRLRYDPATGAIERWYPGSGRWKDASIQTNKGYCNVWTGKELIRAHRVAWALHYGHWPELFLDHINGIRNDNRIDNLREVTHAQNMQNRNTKPKRRANSKVEILSSYIGVYWRKDRSKWVAEIQVDGKTVTLGYFRDEEEAHAARCAAVMKHYTHSPLNVKSSWGCSV